MSYRQHVLKEMTLLFVVDKIVIDPKWFHWISLHYVILWIYLCWCMLPHQTHLISVSKLSWVPHYTLTCICDRLRQNRIPFNILTAMSSVYQNCKSLAVFYALFMPLSCAVNRLQTGQPRNWYERFFTPPQFSDQFWCPVIWCSGWYWGLFIWR
jgi:hypothetical protein